MPERTVATMFLGWPELVPVSVFVLTLVLASAGTALCSELIRLYRMLRAG